MIARLVGSMVAREGGRAVIDVQGVGYEVFAPSTVLDDWTTQEGAVVVHVCTDVREDAITLYGFADDVERVAFVRLRTVNGVGPKVALAALDTLGLVGVAKAVASDDVRGLTAIPGVGKKLASRMALELKGKLPEGFDGGEVGTPVKPAPSQGPDIFALTLARLGYTRTEINRARDALAAEGLQADTPVEQQVTAALRVLTRG